jgi:hypothetical protein
MSCDDSNNAVYVSSNGELVKEDDRFGVDENKDDDNL